MTHSSFLAYQGHRYLKLAAGGALVSLLAYLASLK